MLENILKFINYWWLRYTLVTELYIVQKWERVTFRKNFYNLKINLKNNSINLIIDIMAVILFLLFAYFNYAVVLKVTGQLFYNRLPLSSVIGSPLMS